MRHLEGNMRMLKYLVYSISLRLRNEMMFRMSFFLKLLGKISYILVYFLFFDVIFSHTGNIGGWNKGMVYMLLGTTGIIFSLFSALSNMGAASIMELVRKGGIEFILLKPLPAPFFILFRFASASDLISTAVPLGIFIYGLILYSKFTILGLFLWVISVIFSFFLYSTLHLLLGLLSFKFIRISGFYWMLADFADLGKYPYSIFPYWFGKFLLYFLPVLLISNYPVLILTGRFHLLFIQIAVLSFFLILLKFLFPIALRSYQGAGTYEI